MGAILSFFFPSGDTEPDASEDEGGIKEVEKADTEKILEVTDGKVTVPKIREEAMEEADYELVEKTNDGSRLPVAGFPRTPHNSFAVLPSFPAGQLDDGFERISQRTGESPSLLLNVDNTAAVVETEEAKKEEESPNLKSGVEALFTDLSASSGAEQEETSSTATNNVVKKEETSTATTAKEEASTATTVKAEASTATTVKEESCTATTVIVESIGEVEDDDIEHRCK